MPLLSHQYEMVQSSRRVLLNYCETISQDDFIRSSPDFGKGGSIRNLMVHTCNTYQGWLAELAGRNRIEQEYTDVPALLDCRYYYSVTNEIVTEFLKKYENKWLDVLEINSDNDVIKTTPLQLFSHVITHEFHHKGQILSLSRLWGYKPVDTDIMR